MKKTYTITLDEDEKGKWHMKRTCDGFSPVELLGILEMSQLEILQQRRGEFKPDIIKREVVKRNQRMGIRGCNGRSKNVCIYVW